MPTTPTRSVGLKSNTRIGVNTVTPPQSSGPASRASRPSGIGIAHGHCSADLLGKTAVAPNDGAGVGRTKVLIAVKALLAVHAACRGPADTDALADLYALGIGAERGDAADNLVPGHQRIGRHAPLVEHHRCVGVADAARLDRDLDVVGAERPRIILERLERLVGALRGPCFDRHSRFLSPKAGIGDAA